MNPSLPPYVVTLDKKIIPIFPANAIDDNRAIAESRLQKT